MYQISQEKFSLSGQTLARSSLDTKFFTTKFKGNFEDVLKQAILDRRPWFATERQLGVLERKQFSSVSGNTFLSFDWWAAKHK